MLRHMVSMLLEMGNIHLVVYIIQLELVLALERYRNGEFTEGFSHPEMGHALVRRHPEDTYAGNCPYHGDCLEGIAAGPQLKVVLVKKDIYYWKEYHKLGNSKTYYLAQAAYNTTYY